MNILFLDQESGNAITVKITVFSFSSAKETCMNKNKDNSAKSNAGSTQIA